MIDSGTEAREMYREWNREKWNDQKWENWEEISFICKI